MHFRRGLHYLIVRAAELIVPIPLLENGDYDFRVVQEVVYDMKKVHEDFVSRGQHPVDYAFEARMMSGSELYLSSQYGNSASLAIEVATSPLIPEHVWVQFKVGVGFNDSKYFIKNILMKNSTGLMNLYLTECPGEQLAELQGPSRQSSAGEAPLGQGVPPGGWRSGHLRLHEGGLPGPNTPLCGGFQ